MPNRLLREMSTSEDVDDDDDDELELARPRARRYEEELCDDNGFGAGPTGPTRGVVSWEPAGREAGGLGGGAAPPVGGVMTAAATAASCSRDCRRSARRRRVLSGLRRRSLIVAADRADCAKTMSRFLHGPFIRVFSLMRYPGLCFRVYLFRGAWAFGVCYAQYAIGYQWCRKCALRAGGRLARGNPSFVLRNVFVCSLLSCWCFVVW